MSSQTPPNEPQRPPWAPPAGWSPQQPPAWTTPPPGPEVTGAPSGQGQPGTAPPSYGQPGTAPPPYGQPGTAQPPYGQPGTAQPPYGQPGTAQPPGPVAGWGPPVQQGPPPGWWPSAATHGGQWVPPAPAPKPGIVPLRPLNVGELLEGALGLIRSNPRTVLGTAAVISIILAVIETIGGLLAVSLIGDLETAGTQAAELEDLTVIGTAAVVQVVPTLIAGFLQVLASGLFIVLVAAAVLGRRLDATSTWQLLRPRLAALFGLTILLGVAALAATGAVIVVVVVLAGTLGEWAAIPGIALVIIGLLVGIWVFVRLAVAAPVLVLEGSGLLRAIRRSWALVAGAWWRTAGVLLLSAVITNLLTAVVAAPITVVSMLAMGTEQSLTTTVIASGLAALIAGVVVLPFSAAVVGLLYTDLRMRREALDSDLARAVSHPGPDPLAPFRTRAR